MKFCIDYCRDRIILGATFMKDHDIYFDKVGKMMAFAEANCRGFQENVPQKEGTRSRPPLECLQLQTTLFESSQFDDLRGP